jgi:DNA repair exonuclease SbcCD nuclease subunit
MSTTFLHTADWQLGKPYARVGDVAKRTLLQNERFVAVERLGALARQENASFIVVAGDLFDSPTASKPVVSRACAVIGAIGLPVYVIPGNHDHGGADSIWDTEFFQRERHSLAPNLHLLLKPEPVELEDAVLFPCPLLRRHESADTTQWLRHFELNDSAYGTKPRIVLAHGSVTHFGSAPEDDEDSSSVNLIDLNRLPGAFDYLALGDWHGTKEATPKAWYSGTPELDRFVKGTEHRPGNVLMVKVARGENPEVRILKTAKVGWHELDFRFTSDTDLSEFETQLRELLGTRAGEDVLQLQLAGSLGIEACTRLENILESIDSRLLRLKLNNSTRVTPTPEELENLTQRASDPLISRVATRLAELAHSSGPQSDTAQVALRELYASTFSR